MLNRSQKLKILIAFGLIGGLRAFALESRWISGNSQDPECPAPVLERTFELNELPASATFSVAVAGWCEVQVNGVKVGEDLMTPTTCQPDMRLPSLTLDIASFLRRGENRISVLLGNGWFNAFTRCSWKFDEAPWTSCPKFRGEVKADGRTIVVTDEEWLAYDSAIVFNALRNGEWYDARLAGVRRNERPATVEKHAPAGRIMPEDAPPCRAFDFLDPKRVHFSPDGAHVYDFGANISGWCEIDVKGGAGAKILIDYDESLTPSNALLGYVTGYLARRAGEPRPVQHDEYTLAGRSEGERWHPRFAYHGFRYAKVSIRGDAKLRKICARFVHSAFRPAGSVDVSDRTFAALQMATVRSYLSNFVGIPTDCPHREKNGWTGDAQLAMETGLWNFDARDGYVHFLRMALDAQRSNGAIPCILPCTPKFGFAWGSGPAWDAVLFEIPWQVYRFYGDDGPARESYDAMKRYLAFIGTKEDPDGLYAYGLGDWCHPDRDKMVELRLTDSAYVYQFNRRLAFWARRFGEGARAVEADTKADRIAQAFNSVFYHGNGSYAKDELTALAAPLYFKGLCARGEERLVVRRLVERVRCLKHTADFGILGAKWVPRVLSDYGYVDDAWELFTQTCQPGWAHWLQFGDGTLRENWDDSASHNHIMFGDLSAWAYECLAGIRIIEPGFNKVTISPSCPRKLDSYSVRHRTPHGMVTVTCRRENGCPVYTRLVPPGVELVNNLRYE